MVVQTSLMPTMQARLVATMQISLMA